MVASSSGSGVIVSASDGAFADGPLDAFAALDAAGALDAAAAVDPSPGEAAKRRLEGRRAKAGPSSFETRVPRFSG